MSNEWAFLDIEWEETEEESAVRELLEMSDEEFLRWMQWEPKKQLNE